MERVLGLTKNVRVSDGQGLIRLGGPSAPPAFDPESLFAGRRGIILDPGRYAKTPTSPNPGDAISSITAFDSSGGTMVFSQATSTKRPLWQMDGDRPYLQFDGVDDALLGESGLTLLGAGRTVITAVRKLSDSNIGSVVESVPLWTAANRFAHYSPSLGSSANHGVRWQTSAVQSILNSPNSYASPHTAVVTSLFATGTHKERVNGAEVASGTPTGTLGSHGDALSIGGRNATSLFFNGRIYAMLIVDAVLAGQELIDAETWAASKCGVTL